MISPFSDYESDAGFTPVDITYDQTTDTYVERTPEVARQQTAAYLAKLEGVL